jgi:hypothetical protein
VGECCTVGFGGEAETGDLPATRAPAPVPLPAHPDPWLLVPPVLARKSFPVHFPSVLEPSLLQFGPDPSSLGTFSCVHIMSRALESTAASGGTGSAAADNLRTWPWPGDCAAVSKNSELRLSEPAPAPSSDPLALKPAAPPTPHDPSFALGFEPSRSLARASACSRA